MTTPPATDHDDTTAPAWLTVPWPGAAVALATVALMVTASIVAWPDMSAEIVTRAADGRHGQSTSSRGVTAVALPATLLLLTALLTVAPRLDHELLHRTPLGQDRSPERARRVLGWALTGLSVVVLALHVGLLSLHTGGDLPIEQTVAAATGVLLVCLGIALPLAAPGGRLAGRAERFRAGLGPGYRLAGVLVVIGGIATTVAATSSVGVALGVAVSTVVVAFAAAAVVALRRSLTDAP